MDSNPFLPVVDFNQGTGNANFYSFADELERHGVVLMVDTDVVVQADGDCFPFRIFKRKRWDRLCKKEASSWNTLILDSSLFSNGRSLNARS